MAVLAVLATALTLGVVFAGRAQAVNCSFGDNFYQFVSDSSGGQNNGEAQSIGANDPNYLGSLVPDVNGDEWCQTNWGVFGSGWSEWVLKNTSYCMTLNASAGYKVDLVTCNNLVSQQWALLDQIGSGENWGRVLNAYIDSGGGHHSLYCAYGCADDTVPTGWTSGDSNFSFFLGGPYR